MGHFMGDNVVLKSSVTLRLRVLLQNKYNRQFVQLTVVRFQRYIPGNL